MSNKIRTYEELEKDDFENMTFKELCVNDVSCEQCPLFKRFCSGGMECYGGVPIEPPCCSFDDDDILQDKCDEFVCNEFYWDKMEEEKSRLKKEKEEKSRIRKEKYKAYKLRNWDDLNTIKKIKKEINARKKLLNELDRFNNYAFAVNMTNKMFRECNCDCPNDINTEKSNQHQRKILEDIELLENKIKVIRQKIKENEKLFKGDDNE